MDQLRVGLDESQCVVSDARAEPGTSAERRGRLERLVWRIAGGVFALVILVCGVAVVLCAVAHRCEEQQQVYHRTVTRIVVEGRVGGLTIVPGPDDTVTVRRTLVWSWVKPTSHETWDGQTLRLRPDCGFAIVGDDCRVGYRLSVPAAVVVEATSGFGGITVDGVLGELTLRTGTGSIVATNTGGPLSAASEGGRIRATNVMSPHIRLSTGSGDVDLVCAAAPTHVTARSAGGDVSVTVPRGDSYLVTAGADDGDVAVSVLREPTSGRSITARTGTGDVTIRYP